ncbi:MAG: allophanate hydrolase [Proteobacteria bacterium]|nr:MAG: allophanate hydrolase [Pseudomonadota bacterium]
MASPLPDPRILPSGDTALTVEFGRTVDTAINARVLAFDRTVAAARLAGVIETVPTYRSLLVHYDPVATGFADLSRKLLALARHPAPSEESTRRWRIPVAYGGAHGIDLDALAERHGITPDEVVRRHTSGDYRVTMLGFTPGYSYLSGLDPSLATPRRNDPRTETPAGTISIGGIQTGIQCIAAPSGWHLIGRTPVRTFHPHREPMFLLEPGDAVTFFAIDAVEFAASDAAAAAGEIVAEQIAP